MAAGETFTTGRTYLPPGDAGPAAPVVQGGLSAEAALAELRTIGDGLEPEVDAVAQPIQAIDGVVKALQDFPRTYRLKPAQVKALAKASLGGRTVALPADLRPEITEELSALLARVKAADSALGATPDHASALLAKIATLHARVKLLADAAEAPASATLHDPAAPADKKAAAEAHIAEIQDLQLAARKKLDATRTRVTDLSSQIMQAIAKLGDATS